MNKRPARDGRGQFQRSQMDKKERGSGLRWLVAIAVVALLLVAAFSSDAHADVTHNEANSGASAVGVNDNAAINAGVKTKIEFNGDTRVDEARNPVSSAVAPSSFSQAPCQGWTSAAGQFLTFGGSGGGSRTITWCVPLFMATLPGTTEQDMLAARALSEQIMCNTDGEYKKARAQQGNECLE